MQPRIFTGLVIIFVVVVIAMPSHRSRSDPMRPRARSSPRSPRRCSPRSRRRSSPSARHRGSAAGGQPPLRVVTIQGDGNCLFRALAYPSNQHQMVRRCLTDHLAANWEWFKEFLTDKQREDYTLRMQQDGVWGDELVIKAFSDLARVNVFVTDAATGDTISEYRPKHPCPSLAPCHLRYNGVHYDRLVP